MDQSPASSHRASFFLKQWDSFAKGGLGKTFFLGHSLPFQVLDGPGKTHLHLCLKFCRYGAFLYGIKTLFPQGSFRKCKCPRCREIKGNLEDSRIISELDISFRGNSEVPAEPKMKELGRHLVVEWGLCRDCASVILVRMLWGDALSCVCVSVRVLARVWGKWGTFRGRKIERRPPNLRNQDK